MRLRRTISCSLAIPAVPPEARDQSAHDSGSWPRRVCEILMQRFTLARRWYQAWLPRTMRCSSFCIFWRTSNRKQRNLCLPHCCRTLLSGLHFGRVCRVFGSLLSLTRASCVSVSVGDATNGHALSNIRESWKMSSSFCAISLLCRVRRPEAQRRVQLCTAGLD